MRLKFLQSVLVVALAGCSAPSVPDAGCSEPKLFGAPVAQTGLSSAQCGPSCACPTAFTSRTWSAAQLDALRAWTLDVAFAEVTDDPYAAPDASTPAPGDCVFVDLGQKRYRVETRTDGGTLTHHGACGVCSTLQDLRVYAADPDLGKPVKQCGVDTFGQGFEANVTCLQNLGFTRPCAQIWAWNTKATRAACLDPCVRFGGDPYHLADGGLNACLACDETKSGPVFKAVAGRTRRNTGIASAICRPCSESAPVAHGYVP